MKLSKEEADQMKNIPTAARSNFSKLADFNPPDSPEVKKEEDDDPNGPNKFDQLMKAACSIKSHQLEQQRKKFELLPSFLKAGVYYTQKHELTRFQESFDIKLYSYLLISKDANGEFLQKEPDRACRRYEEALGMFRYFEATSPDWQSKGIDDDKLREVDDLGKTDYQKKRIHQLKVITFLNIAACNIKANDFKSAVDACNEVFKLEPNNLRAFYRRARGTALPINAGVPEFRKAVKDLDQLLALVQKSKETKMGEDQYFRTEYVLKEKERLTKLIGVNSKRERATYSKMFNSKVSVADQVEKQIKSNPAPKPIISSEQKEMDDELDEIRIEVMAASRMRIKDFSFGIKTGWEKCSFPEINDLQRIVDETVETYRLLKKGGKFKEADMCKAKIKESMFAQNHLKLVMSMDFDRPSEQTIQMASENGINLKNEKVKEEFRKIQQQNLTDIQLMKEGKLPDPKERENEIDLGQKLQLDRDKEFQRRLKEAQGTDYILPEILSSACSTEDSPKGVGASNGKSSNAIMNQSKEKKSEKPRNKMIDYVIVIFAMLLWLAFFMVRNYPNLLGIQPKVPEVKLQYK